MKDERVTGFFFGATVSTIVILALTYLPSSKIYKYDADIEDCEKTLPRDQNCVITAVPDKVDN